MTDGKAIFINKEVVNNNSSSYCGPVTQVWVKELMLATNKSSATKNNRIKESMKA